MLRVSPTTSSPLPPTSWILLISSTTLLLVSIILVGPQVAVVKAACMDSPTLEAGEYWVEDPGCRVGPTYNDPQNVWHCHCWSNCNVKKGYICEKINNTSGGGSTSTTESPVTTTASPVCTTDATPPLTSGEIWISNEGCPLGHTYNNATTGWHCHCWSHCGYICGPQTAATTTTTRRTTTSTERTTTTTKATTTTTPAPTCTTTATPPLESGEIWISNKGCPLGHTYNNATTGWHCHCWSHCGYICGPMNSTSSSTTTTRTTTTRPTTTTTRATTTTTQASTSGNCTTTATPALATGETWVPEDGCSVGPTYNNPQTNNHCHCWAHCGYICTPR